MSSNTRVPGPIALSAALRGALVIAEQARVVLSIERPSEPAHLWLGGLVALEAELGVQLHDDIVALLALRDPVLELFTGLTLGNRSVGGLAGGISTMTRFGAA